MKFIRIPYRRESTDRTLVLNLEHLEAAVYLAPRTEKRDGRDVTYDAALELYFAGQGHTFYAKNAEAAWQLLEEAWQAQP